MGVEKHPHELELLLEEALVIGKIVAEEREGLDEGTPPQGHFGAA